VISDSEAILRVLVILGRAYPNQGISRDGLDIYVQMLADIPVDLLWRAAERHMAESQYFPRISELRSQAARLAGTDRFASLSPTAKPDLLAARAQDLEDDFFEDRTLDERAWLALAEEFERADRPHRALHTRKKLAAFQVILEQEAKDESPVIS
jgi:hypothetical protein